MKDINVSMFENCVSTLGRPVDALAIFNAIKKGRWREEVGRIRRLYSETLKRTGSHDKAKKAVEHLKKNLPGVTWSGKFSRRGNEYLLQHSGLFGGDIDADALGGKDPKEVRAKLRTSLYVVAVFLSPTGHGLKVIFRAPPDASKHEGSFRTVRQHVLDLTGVQIDESGKDLARLCFVSDDPDAYLNPNAQEITPRLIVRGDTHQSVNKNVEHLGKPSKEEIREMLRFIPERPDYADWIKIVTAVGDALPEADAIELLQEWSPEEKAGEYADKLRHRLGNVTVGTLIHQAQKHGWHLRNSANLIGKPGSIVDVDTQRTCEITEPIELPPALSALYVPPPLNLLPSELREYVHAAAESLNVDDAFIFLPLLSSLATAIGNSRSITLKPGFIQPPVVWSGIIARSGGRKSPSEQEGCSPIMAHERELMRQNKEAAEMFAEELSQWESQRRKRGHPPEKPSFITCTCDDLTIEVLADILATNPRGILVRKDELSHWLASFDQYKNARGSDVSRWLSLHTAVSLAVDRRTDSRHYRIINPRVSITGGIQPKILRRALTPEFFERGLPARFIFAFPPFRQDRWSEATVPGDLRAKVLDSFLELWLLHPLHGDPELLPLDSDAKAVFVGFYNQCGECALEASEHEEAAWGKLSGYGARFALIGQLAHNPHAKVVSGVIMRAACDLARWSGNEAVRIYDELAETQEQRERREFVEFIERRGGAVYEREVMQSFTRLKNDKDGTARELNALVKAGRGKWEPVDHGGGPGRPTRKFHLLRLSTSTQFGISRGKTENSVDVDAGSSQKITPAEQPKIEPVSAKESASEPADIAIGEDPEGETIL